MIRLFKSNRWDDVMDKCSNPALPSWMFSEVKEAVLSSKEKSTVCQYKNCFSKFVSWCKKCKFSSLPASPVTVALYLVSVMQNTNTSCSKSKLNSIFYAIKWAHLLNGEISNPSSDEWLKLCLEGCLRKVSKPLIKKEPITVEILSTLVNKFASENCTLADLRLITLFVISFAGFLRISEALNLKACNIQFFDNYCSIKIEKSKTDIYRDGQHVVLARTGNITCPVTLLDRYFCAACLIKGSGQYLFRAVQFCSSTKQFVLRKANKPLSYSRVRELFIEKLNQLGLDHKLFGLHSFRSGGATFSANSGTKDRLWKRHGRWRSETAKDGYIKDSLQDRLSVTLNLNL
ncbi:integrase/recombinase xerD homolog [Mercenaria mercenaria]|uniref:integrase/recombinase xerD homolog n=1 Tax=Mercenaria mercenaria TaxID=6596 RepID=UPI001E1D7F7A|nr:integrase/recombinase xerD homolog isoform X1 [Mercenaria mercenaria]XP_053408260.1 integrase/recombinase xerD homolog [Mercenaria mercenaria]